MKQESDFYQLHSNEHKPQSVWFKALMSVASIIAALFFGAIIAVNSL